MQWRFLTSPSNFTKFAAATLTASAFTGWLAMKLLVPAQGSSDKEELTRDEAMVRAMIDNAKSSTWQENLENAAMAQERFVLPGYGNHSSQQEQFLQEMSEKSNKLMEEKEAEKRKRQENVEIFSVGVWRKD